MSFWSGESIKGLLGGRWIARVREGARLDGVSTDSRSVAPGNVFIALRGEKFDGHAFLAQAAAGGAALLIVSREDADLAGVSGSGAPGVLLVEDTAQALLRLAQAYRRTLTATKVIAVGGSNGKTTTVRMIDAALRGAMRGRASAKSFNNAVGVPLTILAAQATDQYLVCEVGTNAPGEIAALAKIVEPDIAVITSLGREHLEGLGTILGVAREEAALVGALRQGGCAIVHDDPLLTGAVSGLVRQAGGRPRVMVTFGSREGSDLRVVEASQDMSGLTFTLQDRSAFRVPLLGLHNASNAAAAVAVARRLGIEAPTIRAGLASVQGPPMRLERVVARGVTFINDAYNANPESMGASLETFSHVATGEGVSRRVLVLGDMLELGAHADALHAEVGTFLAGHALADLIILVGSHMEQAGAALAKRPPGATVVRLPDVGPPHDAHAAGMLREGDLVLLKGSRGMGLERVIGAWRSGGGTVEGKPAGVGSDAVKG